MKTQNFRDFLQSEFILRCRKNPRYSVRAFARSLNVDHSTLSQILRGKRSLTKKMVSKLAKSLDLTPSQLNGFLKGPAKSEETTQEYQQLSLDTYTLISDWYHYAIFELLTVRHFKQDAAWIAQTLNISTTEAQNALDRLKRTGLLVVDSKGLWKQGATHVTTVNNEFTAAAFRNLQKGLLQLSLNALEQTPFELRDHSSMTMAIHTKRIPEAKKRIRKFRRELCEWLQTDSDRNAVYEMVLSFFPVTFPTKENL